MHLKAKCFYCLQQMFYQQKENKMIKKVSRLVITLVQVEAGNISEIY